MDYHEMIKRCQIGEEEAFKELFETVKKKALYSAYLISGNRELSEDILQETYILCFKEIKNLRNPEYFRTWFYKILMHVGWEMTKKHSKLVPLEQLPENKYYLQDENIMNSEMKIVIHNAINDLNNKLKTVVILYYYNDMSIEEVSKVLSCLKTTVKSRLFYARANLKKKLSDSIEEECLRNK